MKFLVTAGNTRERIDKVRDWGNIFTGNTGYSIAQALSALGDVDLLTSNRNHLAEIERGNAAPAAPAGHRIVGSAFMSHQDLRAALEALMVREKYDAVFMTAAIADYRPSRVYSVMERKPGEPGTEVWIVKDVQAGKVKSSHREIAVLGQQTQKLVDLYRTDWRYKGLLVKFKLEVGIPAEELLKIGEASRVASGADYLVANTLEMVEGPGAGAYLLSEGKQEWVPRGTLAGRLRRLVEETVVAGRQQAQTQQ